ncbi:hypothetical protein Hanom_Chr05g00389971 [Helianthus anomalus]
MMSTNYLLETNPFIAFLWCIFIIKQTMPSLPKYKYITNDTSISHNVKKTEMPF